MPILRLAGKAPRRRRPVNSALDSMHPYTRPVAAVLITLLTAGVHVATFGQSSLVTLQVDEPASGGGKPLKMSFAELQREVDYSLVEVVFISGASVPSSMFVLKGMCAVMRARSERFVQTELVGSNPTRYRVTFPRQVDGSDLRGSDKKAFSEQECSLLKL